MFKACHIFDKQGVFFDALASWRLRVAIPKEGLRKLGINSYSATYPSNDALNIYHKHYIKEAPEWIKETGGIFDIVDDHFKMEDAEHYYKMCKNTTMITCSTKGMKKRIFEETGRDSVIVQDSYDSLQFKSAEPVYKDTKTVCWFGHENNLLYLREIGIPCKGDLITNSDIQKHAIPDLKVILKQGWTYIPWYSGIMPNIFKKHDIVVIPYGNSPKQYAKSPNRIVDAIRNGMIVVTNDTPVVDSYNLRDFVVVNDNISEGIKSVWDNPEEVIQKCKVGQEYIERNLSPFVIAKQWAKVIRGQC